MRGEGVDQSALLQRLDAVYEIGRNDEAAALLQHFGAAVDQLQAASVADLKKQGFQIKES